MPRARDYASLLLAAFAAVLLTKNAEGAEAPPLELEAKIALGDVRGRIDHMAVDLERHRLFVARRFLGWSD
jgi:hypothetical protein